LFYPFITRTYSVDSAQKGLTYTWYIQRLSESESTQLYNKDETFYKRHTPGRHGLLEHFPDHDFSSPAKNRKNARKVTDSIARVVGPPKSTPHVLSLVTVTSSRAWDITIT
jgi:hypothetical protein